MEPAHARLKHLTGEGMKRSNSAGPNFRRNSVVTAADSSGLLSPASAGGPGFTARRGSTFSGVAAMVRKAAHNRSAKIRVIFRL